MRSIPVRAASRLVVFATVVALPGAPALRSGAPVQSSGSHPPEARLVPDIVTAGAPGADIAVEGADLAAVREVRLRGCAGDTLRIAVRPSGPGLRLRVPASLLTRPCVLRVMPEHTGLDLPLAVADPALYGLTVAEPSDENEWHPWAGMFNSVLCAPPDFVVPEYQTVAAILSDSAIAEPFVLGKGDRVVMRVSARRLPSPEPGCWGHLLLPGVESSDVRWDGDDVEHFWLGTLARDGRTVHDRQPLSLMVTEPSGPLDTGVTGWHGARR